MSEEGLKKRFTAKTPVVAAFRIVGWGLAGVLIVTGLFSLVELSLATLSLRFPWLFMDARSHRYFEDMLPKADEFWLLFLFGGFLGWGVGLLRRLIRR